MKSFIFIAVCAIFLGSASYLGSLYFFAKPAAPVAKAAVADKKPRYALALLEDKPAGSLLRAGDMAWRPAPDESAASRLVTAKSKSAAKPVKAVLTQPVTAGAFLAKDGYLTPDRAGYLAALIGEGMRAATVSIDNLAAYADILRPGDHIDLILRYVAARNKGVPEYAARTLLHDLRLVEIGGSLGADTAKAAQNGKAGRITLAVTPQQAEILTVAEKKGSLSLVPRGGDGAIALPVALSEVRESDLFPAEKAPDIASPRVVRVMRGSDISVVTLDAPASGGALRK